MNDHESLNKNDNSTINGKKCPNCDCMNEGDYEYCKQCGYYTTFLKDLFVILFKQTGFFFKTSFSGSPSNILVNILVVFLTLFPFITLFKSILKLSQVESTIAMGYLPGFLTSFLIFLSFPVILKILHLIYLKLEELKPEFNEEVKITYTKMFNKFNLIINIWIVLQIIIYLINALVIIMMKTAMPDMSIPLFSLVIDIIRDITQYLFLFLSIKFILSIYKKLTIYMASTKKISILT